MQESYDAAMGKLREGRGNLIGQTEKLRTLGAKTTAQPLELADAEDE
jgi:DNA anti-recombination protein RmuC